MSTVGDPCPLHPKYKIEYIGKISGGWDCGWRKGIAEHDIARPYLNITKWDPSVIRVKDIELQVGDVAMGWCAADHSGRHSCNRQVPDEGWTVEKVVKDADYDRLFLKEHGKACYHAYHTTWTKSNLWFDIRRGPTKVNLDFPRTCPNPDCGKPAYISALSVECSVGCIPRFTGRK